jgi:transcriptional regulator with XRE-family HTH domain
MSPPNFLRVYRKRSPLTQRDIAFLLQLPDHCNISRYESGQREPDIEVLLTYRHVFDTSLESFYRHQSELIRPDLVKRIQELIEEVNKENGDQRSVYRIRYLKEVIIRLTN